MKILSSSTRKTILLGAISAVIMALAATGCKAEEQPTEPTELALPALAECISEMYYRGDPSPDASLTICLTNPEIAEALRELPHQDDFRKCSKAARRSYVEHYPSGWIRGSYEFKLRYASAVCNAAIPRRVTEGEERSR